MAIPFYATQRIQMRKDKIESGDPITAEDGIKIKCKVVKNRLSKGNPFKTCNYYAIYGQGIDGTAELGTVLVREGVLRKAGAWIRLENESGDIMQVETGNGKVDAKWNGNANFVKFLRENPVTREYFEKLLDEKLVSGKVGISLNEEEIKELKSLNSEISDDSVESDEEVAVTK